MRSDSSKICKHYHQISDWWDRHRPRRLKEKSYIDQVLDSLKPNACILDLGCGTGRPIAEYILYKGYHLVGMDGAEAMIDKCRQRFPEATWIVGDMRFDTIARRFEVIIAWDSFFHLSHQDQRLMFSIFKNYAKKDTMLLFTTGPEYGEVISPMDGHDFYHASLDHNEYRQLLEDSNFEVITSQIAYQNHSLWVWIARSRL